MGTAGRQELSEETLKNAETFWSDWYEARAQYALRPVTVTIGVISAMAVIKNAAHGNPWVMGAGSLTLFASVLALVFMRFNIGRKWVWALPYFSSWIARNTVIYWSGGGDSGSLALSVVVSFALGIFLQSSIPISIVVLWSVGNFLGWIMISEVAPGLLPPADPTLMASRGWFTGSLICLATLVFFRGERQLSRRVIEIVRRAREAEVTLVRETEIHQAKAALLSHVSHELLTPLAIVRGYAELLDREMPPPLIENYGQRITAQTDRAVILVNNLLHYTAIETGQVLVNKAEVALRTVVATLISLREKDFAAKNLRLRVSGLAALPDTILSDHFIIEKVLGELLNNALAFSDEGLVEVSCSRPSADTVKISVADQGRGIPEHMRVNLFEPFIRSATDTATPTIGAGGLGLALSRRLARLLGGDVVLEETVPGQGSRFAFFLPIEM